MPYGNPFDAEYGGGAPLNGTLVALPPGLENRSVDGSPFLAELHTADDDPFGMLDIYRVGVGGVIIVGAVFACGIVAAILFFNVFKIDFCFLLLPIYPKPKP